ncbi:ABC transporter substrate-binding protein [Streptomyces shenzhenensis]|uniref:ABC transporter substrate-binding protein n=1 Tax=Streptomyces shenzhenensis TaxID=943815 RepID=UPI001C692F2B|nr:ABC transporter substrate-binding protein [Streptomyces shenzhenensis]
MSDVSMRGRGADEPGMGMARGTRLRFVAVAAVGALTLVGCGGGGGTSAGGRTTIRFTYATGDETWNTVLKAVTDAFNKQSKDAVVKLDPLPAGSDYATAVKTMDATGNWPAIIDMRDAPTYIKAKKLAPIPKDVTSLLQDDVYAPAPDGNVYVVPGGALNGEIGMNIVYDKDYFAKHGLEVPATYDDFIGLMKKIKADGDVPLATAAAEVWPSDQLWKPLAAPVFAEHDKDGGYWNQVQAGKASLDELRKPLEKLKYITDNFVLKGWQSTADAQTTTLLVNHKVVMATSSAGTGRLLDIYKVDPKFNAGLFIVPDEQGKINVMKSSVNGESAVGLSISAQAQKNKPQYEAATEFLKFFYSLDTANLIEKTGALAPNIKDSDKVVRNTSIPGSKDYFALLKNPNLVWFDNTPTMSTFASFNTFFRQARIEMQDGQTTIDEALKKIKAEFQKDAASAG